MKKKIDVKKELNAYFERAKLKQEFYSIMGSLQFVKKPTEEQKILAYKAIKLYYKCWPKTKTWAKDCAKQYEH